MIEYKEFNSELIEDIINVYKANNWQAYLGDKEKLIKAFNNSLYVLGAFNSNKLVGFLRAIGDTQYVLYIQDLVVLPEYHHKGIGKELVKRTSLKFPNERHFFLITDGDDKNSNAFYQAIGLTRDFNGYPINHYFRKK